MYELSLDRASHSAAQVLADEDSGAVASTVEQSHTHNPPRRNAQKRAVRKTGLSLAPIQTLVPVGDQVSHFTHEEETKFAHRYENGYDLKHDVRYNLWLEVRHSVINAPDCDISDAIQQKKEGIYSIS